MTVDPRALLADATPRPWTFDHDDIVGDGAFVVETFGPDDPDSRLIVAAVNEYEPHGLLEKLWRRWLDELTGPNSHDRHLRDDDWCNTGGFDCTICDDLDEVRTMLARLDAVRSGT